MMIKQWNYNYKENEKEEESQAHSYKMKFKMFGELCTVIIIYLKIDNLIGD